MQTTQMLNEVNFSPLLRRYTLEEFWALPEREDHSHYNLIAGSLFIVPPPSPPHGNLVWEMNKSLCRFLTISNNLGHFYFPPEPIYRADNPTYLEPDMFFVSSEEMRYDRTTADIVFEVISSTTRLYDRTTKADTYLALGVRELWLVDPVSLTVEVRHPNNTGETPVWKISKYSRGEHAKSRVLGGWEVSVDDVFKGLPESTLEFEFW